jgi:hypothetical protein
VSVCTPRMSVDEEAVVVANEAVVVTGTRAKTFRPPAVAVDNNISEDTVSLRLRNTLSPRLRRPLKMTYLSTRRSSTPNSKTPH